ncbi:MAG: LysM peptidoglycan-binding domain-containing protein [Spirochaetia bacterium]
MSDSTIGIKVADGSYYPILEHGFRGRKKLVLTTVKDNQNKVQIDLYRGNGSSLSEARYIGSLLLENIPPAAKGEPEIDLVIGVDAEGRIDAEASDARTGESQRFSASLETLSETDTFGEPEFAMESGPEAQPDFEEPPLTGEAYPVGEKDRREESLHRQGPNILLLVLFVVLGVALVAAIAYFVYRAVQGPQIPPLTATSMTQPAAQPSPQPSAAAPAASSTTAAPAAAAPATTAAPAPSTANASAASPQKGAVTYRIKKGDTLWDISATYYRNPWLYPKLAKANSIPNPDLIFAGTRIVIPEN